MSDRYEQLHIESREALAAWLAAHHDTSPGVWLVTFKKASGGSHVPYAAVVEEALRVGWVDSRGRALDESRSQLLLTPRRRGSGWSRPNKERVARLEAAGLMRPPGRAAVDAAKADGSWTALDEVEALVEPADLRAALDGDPEARRGWDGFPPSVRRAILEWIAAARRPETRARRVAETAAQAAVGVRANRWPRPPG